MMVMEHKRKSCVQTFFLIIIFRSDSLNESSGFDYIFVNSTPIYKGGVIGIQGGKRPTQLAKGFK